jgi:hypothetical protein
MYSVAVEPDGVLTTTELTDDETTSVVVPDGVAMLEMTVGTELGTVTVAPVESTKLTLVDETDDGTDSVVVPDGVAMLEITVGTELGMVTVAPVEST